MGGETGDPFHAIFFARIPADVARSFSPAQLDAVKLAFGARSPGAHAVDLRFSVPMGRRSWYVVLLAGPLQHLSDHRLLKRLFRPIAAAANAAAAALVLMMFAVCCLGVLYAGKRALGIDVVPGIDMLPDRQIERLLK
jgi:hypothetical protein